MYNEKIEQLIKAALADGVLTEKEKQVLFKKAHEQGIDLDEFEVILDARLFEAQNAEKERRAKAAPKSDKYADVRKCPACGTIIPPNTKVCPGCNMLFNNNESDIKEISMLHDNYIKISNVKSKYPTAPLFLSVFLIVILLNVLPWVYALTCHLGWLGLAIPLTVITLGALFFRWLWDDFDFEGWTFKVFNNNYDSAIAEHYKLKSTAKSFYSLDKSVLSRIDEIDKKVEDLIAKNRKKSKFFIYSSYGVLLLTVIMSLILTFGWFSHTMDKHSYQRTSLLIENAFGAGKIEKAEKHFSEFVDDWDYWNAKGKLAQIMLKSYIELDDEERMLYYARNYGLNNSIYVINYYISKERYQDAINHSSESLSQTYETLETCVKDLVRKNKKDEATQLIKVNSYLFNSAKSDSEYYTSKVVKKLTQFTK